MSIRLIDPPIATQFGSDTAVQFGEVKDFSLNIEYIDSGSGIEQWFTLSFSIEDWEGGASAAEGGTPLRIDNFVYTGRIGDPDFPFTKVMWDALRQDIAYLISMNSVEKPEDDPGAYGRGTAFYD